MDFDIGLNYWWKRFQNLKKILKKYMAENKLSSVEQAVEKLLIDN